MRLQSHCTIGTCCITALLTACGAEPEELAGDLEPIALAVVAGDGQTGAVGEELPHPLVVRATVAQGPKKGVLVNFRVVEGGGSTYAGASLTNKDGEAQDYWTLGPDVGENVVEVRAVHPTTGEKQMFGRFTAIGVIPGPEVCNGYDDDIDGAVDEELTYCFDGVPAPNTDGATCDAGYFDLNAVTADGCERLVEGRWDLNPAVELTCSFIGPAFGSISLSHVDVEVVSQTEIAVTVPLGLGILGGFPIGPVLVPVVPVAGTFNGAGIIDVDEAGNPAVTADGTFSVDGAFTGADSFEATLEATLDLSVSFDFGGGLVFDFDGQCDDLSLLVTGTRTDN